jgi:hypothetical protein
MRSRFDAESGSEKLPQRTGDRREQTRKHNTIRLSLAKSQTLRVSIAAKALRKISPGVLLAWWKKPRSKQQNLAPKALCEALRRDL